jgi:PrtD family type I secretion system ABC transporter
MTSPTRIFRSWADIRRTLQASPHLRQKGEDPRVNETFTTWSTSDERAAEEFGETIGEIRNVLVFVAGFSFVINLLMLVGPLYMMQVYDRVLTSGSIPTLLYLAVVASVLLLCGALLEGTRTRILIRLGGRFDECLSSQLFARIVSQRGPRGSSGAASLRDLDMLRQFLTGAGLFFFFDAPWTPLFLFVLLALHPMLFVVGLAGAIVLFTLAVANEFTTRHTLAEAGLHMNAASQFAANVSANADTVEAMGMMAGLRQRWLDRWHHGLWLQSLASDRAGLMIAGTKFVRPMLQVAILGVGAYLALRQKISPGAMVAGSILMGRALAPVEGAIGNWRGFILARAAYSRIRDALMMPLRKTSNLPLPKPEGLLSVEQLTGAPPDSGKPVVRNISFRLGTGEILGLVGPSGSGKSTLARFIVGVWAPIEGCARLAGVDVAGWKRSELGPHIGYLSQNIELFDGTIAENIARFQTVDPESTFAAAKLAGVHDMILSMPDGYDTRVGLDGVILSGGQRQRIGLARALYGTPSFVVLDEPNSNLDGQGELALLTALRELRERGTTVIVISHRPSVLEVVDKILLLREGCVSLFGPRQQILLRLSQATQRSSVAAASSPQPDDEQFQAAPAPRAM